MTICYVDKIRNKLLAYFSYRFFTLAWIVPTLCVMCVHVYLHDMTMPKVLTPPQPS